MIVVKIELWPWGSEAKSQELGRTYIWNTGKGTIACGDYEVSVCRKTVPIKIDHSVWVQ